MRSSMDSLFKRGPSQEVAHETSEEEIGTGVEHGRPTGAKLFKKGSAEYLMEGLEDDIENEADVSALDLGVSSGLVLLVDVANDTLDRLKEGLESNGGVHTVRPPTRNTAPPPLVVPLERPYRAVPYRGGGHPPPLPTSASPRTIHERPPTATARGRGHHERPGQAPRPYEHGGEQRYRACTPS